MARGWEDSKPVGVREALEKDAGDGGKMGDWACG